MHAKPRARIFIIEGIAGSGKDTFQKKLNAKLEGEGLRVRSFGEEDMLLSWRHAWIEGINELRLALMESFTEYMEGVLRESGKDVFVLNRFHVSFLAIARKGRIKGSTMKMYESLTGKLEKMPVEVMVLTLRKNEMQERSAHRERGSVWEEHMKRRLKEEGFRDIRSLRESEQEKMLGIVKSQRIPYRILAGTRATGSC